MATGVFAQQPNQKPPQQNPQPGQPGQQGQPQQPPQPAVIPCPQIQVQVANPRVMRDGEQVVFAANVGGGDPSVQPVYSWSVSAGIIVNGQGTRNITVDSTGAGNYRQIMADLLIAGYSYECNTRATATIQVAAPPKKVDEFGDLPAQDEEGKLNSIVNYLSQGSPDRIYIIGYAGRNNVRGYAADVLRRMKGFLAKAGTPADRVVAVDGGFRELPAYEIWVVPIGSESPKATPTIDRKDIVYPKPPPRTPPAKAPAKKP
jgi:hypothetical protein